MKFWSDQKVPAQKPLIRLSLLCLQSCMADVRDGVATFLVDSDLKKAIGKPAAGLTSRLEGMLREAFAFTAILDRDMLNALMLPIGNLLMRSALMIVNTEKKRLMAPRKHPRISRPCTYRSCRRPLATMSHTNPGQDRILMQLQ